MRRQLEILNRDIIESSDTLKYLNGQKVYYHQANVRKREARRKQQILNVEAKYKQLQASYDILSAQHSDLQDESTQSVERLNKKVESLQSNLKKSNKKVKKFQKYKSLYKKKREEMKLLKLKHKVLSETANSSLLDNTIATLKENNVLTEDYRLCIINLLALGIAVHRVGEAIKVVACHLFGVHIPAKDLPSRYSTKRIGRRTFPGEAVYQ